MKENRKLLREVLKDIRHDMTDEEVLNLLADSKISENLAGENEKYTLGDLKFPSASGRQTPLLNSRAAGRSSSPSPAC